MIKKTLLISILFSLICFGSDLIDGIAAIVGEHVILQSEVEQFSRMTANQMQINPYEQPEKYQELKQYSLESLIDEKIMLEQAKIESIEVKDRDVETMLEQQIQSMIIQAGTKDKAEEMLGKKMSVIKRDYRDMVRNRLLVQNLKQTKFADITVTRQEVESFIQENKDSIPDVPVSLDFSHILIKVKPGIEETQKAKHLCDSLLTLIKNGVDFGELAKKYSTDVASAQFGGELGFIERGSFVKEFEEVAFALKEKEISDLVKTEFGYHIIQLIKRKGEKINTRHILIQEKLTKQNEVTAKNLIEKIYNDIQNNIINFDSAAVLYSDDSDSRKNKGRITRMPKNQIKQEEFITILDNLKENQINQVFKTNIGFHPINFACSP